jgi:hypothetical protein
MQSVRWPSVIGMSCVLAWSGLTGCTLFQHETSPYLRDLKAAYDEQGKLDPDAYRINKPFMEHLLKDLDACYKEAN